MAGAQVLMNAVFTQGIPEARLLIKPLPQSRHLQDIIRLWAMMWRRELCVNSNLELNNLERYLHQAHVVEATFYPPFGPYRGGVAYPRLPRAWLKPTHIRTSDCGVCALHFPIHSIVRLKSGVMLFRQVSLSSTQSSHFHYQQHLHATTTHTGLDTEMMAQPGDFSHYQPAYKKSSTA
jgi:hypothetical protein